MQVTELVRHLRARCPSFLNKVAGGIDWESIEASTKLAGLREMLAHRRAQPG